MKRLIAGLAGVGIIIIMFGTIYATVQQAQRSDANMPQIQIAEDTAAALNRGSTEVLGGGTVDMAKSLAPFTIIYDKKGQVFLSSGYVNGQVPKAPLSMLQAANGKTYHAVTWEPKPDLRIASVTVAAKNYYVLSGRSLTEVEKNETHTFQLALLGGIGSLILFGVVIAARLLGFEP